MNSRITLWTGPVFTLYLLLAQRAVAGRGVPTAPPALAIVLGALALAVSAAPLLGQGTASPAGRAAARRFAVLAWLVAAALVAAATPAWFLGDRARWFAPLAGLLLWAPIGAALRAPVAPLGRAALALLEVGAAGLGAGSAFFLGRALFVRADHATHPWAVLLLLGGLALGVGLLVAASLRAARSAPETDPHRQDQLFRGAVGLALPSAGAFLAAHFARSGDLSAAAAALGLSAAAFVAVEAWLESSASVALRGEALRRAMASGIALLLVALLAAAMAAPWPSSGSAGPSATASAGALAARAASVAAIVALVAALSAALRAAAERAFAPFGGRLLGGLRAAREALRTASSLEEVAREVLRPLRVASGRLDAEPVLFAAVPPREVRIDAAGEPRVRDARIPEALVHDLRRAPTNLWVTAEIGTRIVREPELRPVHDALRALEALVAMPLIKGGELEGLLVVPEGVRRVPLRLEEQEALLAFGAELAGLLSMFAERERLLARTSIAENEANRLREQAEASATDQRRLALENAFVRAAGEPDMAVLSAYSEAMRALLAAVSGAEAPRVILGAPDAGVVRVARLMHAKGPVAAGPCVVFDAAASRRESVRARLGEALEAAEGGTLVLLDAPALPLGEQAALFDALSGRAADGSGLPEVTPPAVVITARSEAALRRMDPALLRWLGDGAVRLPPLAERAEDLPSLVLLAIDRAARAHGLSAMGIEPGAMDRLVLHGWPANLAELDAVVERAVLARAARAEASREAPSLGALRIAEQDLPSLWQPAAAVDVLVGTYDELEQRILEHALARAGGNKSEAARLLGLKRTTFLDRLRRFSAEAGPATEDEN